MPRRGADLDGLLPHLQIGLAAVTLEQTEIGTEGFRRFGRGRLRAAFYQRYGATMPMMLPEDAPEATDAALHRFFRGEA